tara:strand:+ start:1680 stop:2567 length:888 start_codon:yes stop_codon:yes gene_type:complete
MITFVQLGKYGRLGNQLFQYAMIKSVSIETGYELKIPDPTNIYWADLESQPCLLNKYNIKCDYLTQADIEKIKYNFSEPDHTKFYPGVFQVPDDINFHGYFQNSQYFVKHQDIIREDLSLVDGLEEEAKDYINSLKKNNEQIVSVHFRRGDNTDGSGGIIQDYYGPNDTLSKDSIFGRYFFEAIKQFDNQNVKFLVFSGGSQKGMNHNQEDIDWCRENLKDDRFLYCEDRSDIQDFAAMKNCDHNILSHQTSFGYWVAFLNKNPNKIVIAPKNYTVPYDDGRVANGFYPSTWKVI